MIEIQLIGWKGCGCNNFENAQENLLQIGSPQSSIFNQGSIFVFNSLFPSFSKALRLIVNKA